MEPNVRLFHESIGAQLQAVKDRVRNLIGDAHWGEEGKFKESILKATIQNHLPSQYELASGFVIGYQGEMTSQLDIIVFERSYPVLFRQGDFVIINADGVRGISEVKTKIRRSDVAAITMKANKNGQTILASHNDRTFAFFNGVFALEIEAGAEQHVTGLLGDTAREFKAERPRPNGMYEGDQEKCLVNHLAFGPDHFIRLWDPDNEECRYHGYALDRLSTSYFVFNLLFCLKPELSASMINTMFPLPTKETFSIGEERIRR